MSKFENIKRHIARQRKKLFGDVSKKLDDLIREQKEELAQGDKELCEFITPSKSKLLYGHLELTERAIVVLVKSRQFSYSEIGTLLGISKQRAQQIYKAA